MYKRRFGTNYTGLMVMLLVLLSMAMLMTGCGSLIELARKAQDVKTITPSEVIVTETREVSDSTALDTRALGKVILTQGDRCPVHRIGQTRSAGEQVGQDTWGSVRSQSQSIPAQESP